MPAIQLENFKKYYGATKAVDGISLTVEVGDIFGFLGPNGAGKTTTIRSMMDFIHPETYGVFIGVTILATIGAALRFVKRDVAV